MKVIAVDKDQMGLVLCDKDARTAIKHYDQDTQEIIIMLGDMAVQVSLEELTSMLLRINKADLS